MCLARAMPRYMRFLKVSAATVIVRGGRVGQVQIGMIERHIKIRLAGSVCFEIDGQAAIREGWMTRGVFNVVTSHGVDSVDAILRFMQAVALGLVAWQWIGRDPDEAFADARRNLPLVDGVGYYFFAATITRDLHHPIGQLLGDLLVRLPSASGQAPEPAKRIPFRSGAVFTGMHHVHLANHPDIYEALRDLLAQ